MASAIDSIVMLARKNNSSYITLIRGLVEVFRRIRLKAGVVFSDLVLSEQEALGFLAFVVCFTLTWDGKSSILLRRMK